MLSTGFPQPIDLVAMALLAVNLVFLIALLSYVVHKSRKDFPTKTEINVLRTEISDLSGLQADLSDRFTRFQRREGMRVAREEKKTQADLQAEALALTQQQEAPQEGTSAKADLYRRARGH